MKKTLLIVTILASPIMALPIQAEEKEALTQVLFKNFFDEPADSE